MRNTALLLITLFIVGKVHAQSELTLKTRTYRQQNERKLMDEFLGLLAIPNVVYDTAGIQKTAAYIADMLKRRGIEPQLLEGRTKGVPPAVYGEVRVPGATKTIVFYAHYDGQPVNPNQWADGLKPFEPALYSDALDAGGQPVAMPKAGDPINPNWRLYGRSTSDDKAGVFTILAAYDALKNMNSKPTANLKFFFEGEEEAGSTHLNEILERHKEKLKSDLWIICDGPVHQTGRKQVLFGVRGDVNMELKVYASKRPLHSGHYGNWAPNPAMMLAKLLSSMKDDDGNVLIKGFYDDVTPLTDLEKQALARIPAVDEQLRQELGFTKAEGGGKTLADLLMRPSLNINGFSSANVGKLAANVIPISATAALDLRLVLGNDAQRQVQKVIDHVKAQGYYVTQAESITDEERARYPKIARIVAKSGYNAQRTPMNLPIAQTVAKAVQSTVKGDIVLQPSLGGSLPLYLFDQILKTPTITVPIANHDNNQHAENENLRIQNLWDGLETYVALMRL
ncbi:M20/M25/M40 family metallo-hydrolase [Spirosoma utsteinense]|uniref:Acetylornithine deacetylase/succinyl-diaminopimelate desuccinylase-like protein n=1 Tax=Spirosoma utsteinense TaxID=2585773 RepID=A0ABR6W7I6_9BACT|nr:M20/M25/M40 family metallo-hydrolase [Spirosoma utsteinense]MBC3783913.1 acetylornithine deacetylase/succinyl-diaminopimelate desuccinylase-like protein [Spirosoma utsteinense]MBC3792547.1 acetylornithine deacetylase/succinyl-diaminopimelate desuccinylase-like protein [Spirosoma utsteinense]